MSSRNVRVIVVVSKEVDVRARCYRHLQDAYRLTFADGQPDFTSYTGSGNLVIPDVDDQGLAPEVLLDILNGRPVSTTGHPAAWTKVYLSASRVPAWWFVTKNPESAKVAEAVRALCVATDGIWLLSRSQTIDVQRYDCPYSTSSPVTTSFKAAVDRRSDDLMAMTDVAQLWTKPGTSVPPAAMLGPRFNMEMAVEECPADLRDRLGRMSANHAF
jgi:hypothetical protein